MHCKSTWASESYKILCVYVGSAVFAAFGGGFRRDNLQAVLCLAVVDAGADFGSCCRCSTMADRNDDGGSSGEPKQSVDEDIKWFNEYCRESLPFAIRATRYGCYRRSIRENPERLTKYDHHLLAKDEVGKRGTFFPDTADESISETKLLETLRAQPSQTQFTKSVPDMCYSCTKKHLPGRCSEQEKSRYDSQAYLDAIGRAARLEVRTVGTFRSETPRTCPVSQVWTKHPSFYESRWPWESWYEDPPGTWRRVGCSTYPYDTEPTTSNPPPLEHIDLDALASRLVSRHQTLASIGCTKMWTGFTGTAWRVILEHLEEDATVYARIAHFASLLDALLEAAKLASKEEIDIFDSVKVDILFDHPPAEFAQPQYPGAATVDSRKRLGEAQSRISTQSLRAVVEGTEPRPSSLSQLRCGCGARFRVECKKQERPTIQASRALPVVMTTNDGDLTPNSRGELTLAGDSELLLDVARAAGHISGADEEAEAFLRRNWGRINFETKPLNIVHTLQRLNLPGFRDGVGHAVSAWHAAHAAHGHPPATEAEYPRSWPTTDYSCRASLGFSGQHKLVSARCKAISANLMSLTRHVATADDFQPPDIREPCCLSSTCEEEQAALRERIEAVARAVSKVWTKDPGLQLRRHQLEMLRWMLAKEACDMSFGTDDVSTTVEARLNIFFQSGYLLEAQTVQHVRGGIVADGRGMGKTATAIALMLLDHAPKGGDAPRRRAEFKMECEELMSAFSSDEHLVPVDASLVIVPKHLVCHWGAGTPQVRRYRTSHPRSAHLRRVRSPHCCRRHHEI